MKNINEVQKTETSSISSNIPICNEYVDGVLVENGRKELGLINGFKTDGSITTIYYGDNKSLKLENSILDSINLSANSEITLTIENGQYVGVNSDVNNSTLPFSDFALQWTMIAAMLLLAFIVTRD